MNKCEHTNCSNYKNCHSKNPDVTRGCEPNTPSKYRISFKTSVGEQHIWERFGDNMEQTLKDVKEEIVSKYSKYSAFAICGDQGDGNFYF